MTMQAGASKISLGKSMNSPRDTLTRFTDAAADAVARAIATVQREAQRERELRDAEHRARLAELDARILSVSNLERRVIDRLAELKDGEPGRDGKNGSDGQDGKDGTDGRDGTSVTVDDCQELIKSEAERVASETAERILSGWEKPKDGKSVTIEELTPLVEETVQRSVSAMPSPKDGNDGKDGRDGADGNDGADGKDGAPGKLPMVREWSDKVHYEGEVVIHAGSTFQASRDTAKEPPHEDWICLARAGSDGADGRSFTIRGTWSEANEYRALDVVALGGASFAARHDDPGPCPGEGWQLIAAQGKRGNPGERGKDGIRGQSGAQITRIGVDDNGLLMLANEDGNTITCDLYPLLSKLAQ